MPDSRDAAPADEALPRYTVRPLPARRHLPGRGPRPDDTEEGLHASAARFDPRAWWTCESFLYGIDLWNRHFFWEAHEAWEKPWRAAGRDTPLGRFLQGLILLAAAALKQELGARQPARRLAARGARRLREARVAKPCFDVPAFAAAVEAWTHGTRPTPPLLQLHLPRSAVQP